jgi:hypothetical protein
MLGAALAAIQASVSTEEAASDASALVSAADAAAAKVVAAPVNSRRRNSSASAKVEAVTHSSAQKKGRPAVGSEEENEETMDDVEVPATGSGDEAPQNERSADPTKSDASSTGSGFPASLHAFVVQGNEMVPHCTSWDEGTHHSSTVRLKGLWSLNEYSHWCLFSSPFALRRQMDYPFTSTKTILM